MSRFLIDLSTLGQNQVFDGIIYDLLYDKKSLSVKTHKHRKQMHQLLIEGINSGVVKPLPRTVFDKEQVEEAFRYMSTGKHTGMEFPLNHCRHYIKLCLNQIV